MKTRQMKRTSANSGCLPLLLVCLLIYGGFWACDRWSHRPSPFQSHLAEYTRDFPESPNFVNPRRYDIAKITGETLPNSEPPYVRPGVVVVSISRYRDPSIDPLSTSLPEDLKATDPSKVQTVVWLLTSFKDVGQYSDGMSASRTVINLTLIDFVKGTIIDRTRFESGDPPKTIFEHDSHASNAPSHQVVEYLEKLPKRLN